MKSAGRLLEDTHYVDSLIGLKKITKKGDFILTILVTKWFHVPSQCHR